MPQKIEVLKMKVEQETEKQQKWKTENERRRHNYVPLIFELLQQLAKKQMLGELFEDAKTKKEEKLEAEKAKKEANGTSA